MIDKTLLDDMALLIRCFPSTSKPHEILNSAYKRIADLEDQIRIRAEWMANAVKNGETRNKRIMDLERKNTDLQANNTKLVLENRVLKSSTPSAADTEAGE